jgi:hypothetical protein
MVDRVYKKLIPARRRDLERLLEEFSSTPSRTDWARLRIEPVLMHARALERLLESKAFSPELARLTRGVELFRSDLEYLKRNVQGLERVLRSESGRKRLATPKRTRR